MEIEIQEFYWDEETKYKNGRKSGTLHIYIPSIDLDVRGIMFIQHKDKWIIRMPHKQALEDGKKVFYPVITFVNIETMKNLLLQIREKGIKYIEEKMKLS